MLIDWMWVVPRVGAATGLARLCRPGGLRARFGLVGPTAAAEAAADAEGRFPELGQRLRTVLQYADPAQNRVPASPGLLEALVRRDRSRRPQRSTFES